MSLRFKRLAFWLVIWTFFLIMSVVYLQVRLKDEVIKSRMVVYGQQYRLIEEINK